MPVGPRAGAGAAGARCCGFVHAPDAGRGTASAPVFSCCVGSGVCLLASRCLSCPRHHGFPVGVVVGVIVAIPQLSHDDRWPWGGPRHWLRRSCCTLWHVWCAAPDTRLLPGRSLIAWLLAFCWPAVRLLVQTWQARSQHLRLLLLLLLPLLTLLLSLLNSLLPITLLSLLPSLLDLLTPLTLLGLPLA